MANVPCNFTSFNFSFRLASYKSNTFWKMCCDNNIANIIASFNVKF